MTRSRAYGNNGKVQFDNALLRFDLPRSRSIASLSVALVLSSLRSIVTFSIFPLNLKGFHVVRGDRRAGIQSDICALSR